MIFINKKAFTLIEMLVVIAIISILGLSVSNINFSSMTDKQKLETFYYNIKNEIETIKNNSLVGKGIGSSLIVPTSWKIDFASGSNIVINSYSGIIETNYKNINIEKFYKIKEVYCADFNGNTGSLSGNTGSIIITGSNISLSGCIDTNQKLLKIKAGYKQFEKTLEINTVSGVLKDL